jgi:hypothetical protein
VNGQVAIFKALFELEGAEVLGNFLKQNLDKNAAAACSLRFIEMDVLKHAPRHSICVQEVGEQLGNIPELVGFQTMNSRVILGK